MTGYSLHILDMNFINWTVSRLPIYCCTPLISRKHTNMYESTTLFWWQRTFFSLHIPFNTHNFRSILSNCFTRLFIKKITFLLKLSLGKWHLKTNHGGTKWKDCASFESATIWTNIIWLNDLFDFHMHFDRKYLWLEIRLNFFFDHNTMVHNHR